MKQGWIWIRNCFSRFFLWIATFLVRPFSFLQSLWKRSMIEHSAERGEEKEKTKKRRSACSDDGFFPKGGRSSRNFHDSHDQEEELKKQLKLLIVEVETYLKKEKISPSFGQELKDLIREAKVSLAKDNSYFIQRSFQKLDFRFWVIRSKKDEVLKDSRDKNNQDKNVTKSASDTKEKKEKESLYRKKEIQKKEEIIHGDSQTERSNSRDIFASTEKEKQIDNRKEKNIRLFFAAPVKIVAPLILSHAVIARKVKSFPVNVSPLQNGSKIENNPSKAANKKGQNVVSSRLVLRSSKQKNSSYPIHPTKRSKVVPSSSKKKNSQDKNFFFPTITKKEKKKILNTSLEEEFSKTSFSWKEVLGKKENKVSFLRNEFHGIYQSSLEKANHTLVNLMVSLQILLFVNRLLGMNKEEELKQRFQIATSLLEASFEMISLSSYFLNSLIAYLENEFTPLEKSSSEYRELVFYVESLKEKLDSQLLLLEEEEQSLQKGESKKLKM